MKKMLLATLLVVCATGVWAEGEPLACQEEDSGGLRWADGKWKTTGYHTQRFVLVLEGDVLSKTSVMKAFVGDDGNSYQVTCTNVNPQIRCEDQTGSSLYYDPRVKRGGIARIFGATLTSNQRDTLSVSAFTCQPF